MGELNKTFTDAEFDKAMQDAMALDKLIGPHNRTEDSTNPSPEPKFAFMTPSKVCRTSVTSWTIRDILPRKGFAVIWGATGSGKSFIAFDLCASIARGMRYHGKRVKQGLVFYVAAEGNLTARIMAYEKANDLKSGELDNLHFVHQSIDLLDKYADLSHLIQSIQCIANDSGLHVALVVIDTLNRAMPSGNENSPDDMGAFIANCKAVEDALNCVVMPIHHSGKDESKGSRGHSSLKAAMDAEISIVRDGDIRTFRIEKVKEGLDYFDLFHFRLKIVDLGDLLEFDSDADFGERLTSCVIEPTDDVPVRKKAMSRNEELLEIAIEQSGNTGREAAREKFYEMHTGNQDARCKAFTRAWAARTEKLTSNQQDGKNS